MRALFANLKRFALVVILFTLAVIPVHLVWADHPIERALSESSREIVAAMISAHGGLEKWRSAPTVSFEDQFLPANAQKPMVSRVTVKQGPRRVYLDFPETNARLAWDGTQAWSENWQVPIPPRFIALLNYYFLNLPWLTMDPGVNLGEPGKAKLWDDPTEYVTVKMTFEAGVGDTPDDYYILYIDPKSYRLKACEYVVTYASLLPPGVKASPPHILIYEDYASVEGFVVPTRYSIYEKNHTLYATCEVRNWSFKKPFDATRMTIPPSAVIDASSPTRTNGSSR